MIIEDFENTEHSTCQLNQRLIYGTGMSDFGGRTENHVVEKVHVFVLTSTQLEYSFTCQKGAR